MSEDQPKPEGQAKPQDQPKASGYIHKLNEGCRRLCANQVVQAGVLIFGVVTGLFGIYSYKASIRERELTYYVSPTRTPIVQKGTLENFEVKLLGNPIQGDLSSAEIQIWNAGKESIRKANVLKAVTIKTPSNQPIYQITIKSTRDITGFKDTGGMNGVVTLDWNILEQSDGAKIQLIYGGGVGLPLAIEGVIEGQKDIKPTKATDPSKNTFGGYFIILLIAVVPVLLKLWAVLSKKMQKKLSRSLFSFLDEAMPGVLLILAVVIATVLSDAMGRWMQSPVTPPFGF